jgi:hypothetical protein
MSTVDPIMRSLVAQVLEEELQGVGSSTQGLMAALEKAIEIAEAWRVLDEASKRCVRAVAPRLGTALDMLQRGDRS